MAIIKRRSQAVWNGNLKDGDGQISTGSGVLQETSYSFATRFEDKPGTNPEELIAAAHAACFSMALANMLSGKGYTVRAINTEATCHLSSDELAITGMHLQTRGKVAGIDEATFKQIAEEAKHGCPVSKALGAIDIQMDAALA
jgi:osmotically inducible protein OsmC